MERQPAPNYTTALLGSLAPIVFVALIIVWAVAGLLAALGLSYAADKGITLIGTRRAS